MYEGQRRQTHKKKRPVLLVEAAATAFLALEAVSARKHTKPKARTRRKSKGLPALMVPHRMALPVRVNNRTFDASLPSQTGAMSSLPRVPDDLMGSAASFNDSGPSPPMSSPPTSGSNEGYDTKTEDEKLSLLYQKWNSSAPVLAWLGLIGAVVLVCFLLFRLTRRRAARKGATASTKGSEGGDGGGGGKKQRGRSAHFALEDVQVLPETNPPQDVIINPVTALESPVAHTYQELYRGPCPSCLERPKSHALVPCSHLVCETCASTARVCPLCRMRVIARNWVISP